MPDGLGVLAILYGAGVLVGLLFTDAPPASRLGLAALWPVGPLAFAVTVSGLLAASLVAFPRVGLAVLVLAALAYSLFWV